MMVLSRLGFGFLGNALPAGLNAIVGGIGWFAVNSVSGALALSTLTGMPAWLALLIVALVQIGVALLGHNLIHGFEKVVLPVLAVVFAITSVVILTQTDPSFVPTDGQPAGSVAGFLLTVGATFGYAAGWNPYATDYTRYLPKDASPKAVGWAAGLGVFVPCLILETVGAASATLATDPDATPTAAFTEHLPGWLAALTLLCIAVGAVAANAINIYSGSMSFVALGIRMPLTLRRALAVGRLRGARLRRRAVRSGGRGRGVRGLPADHRVLDRALARRAVRRVVPASRRGRRAASRCCSTPRTATSPGRSRCSPGSSCRSCCSRTRPRSPASSRRPSRRSVTSASRSGSSSRPRIYYLMRRSAPAR